MQDYSENIMKSEWGKTAQHSASTKNHTKPIIIMLSVMWLAIGIVMYQIVRISRHHDTRASAAAQAAAPQETIPTDARGLGHVATTEQWNTFSLPLEITYPSNNGTVRDSKIMIIGRTRPLATVSTNGTSKQADTNGEFSQVVTLQPGLNTISVQAKDDASRSAEKRLFVNYSTVTIEDHM